MTFITSFMLETSTTQMEGNRWEAAESRGGSVFRIPYSS